MNIKVDINVCRVCLKSNKGISVFSDKVLLEKFQYTTLLKIVKDDGLPALFCERCIARLKIAYDFRRLSIISDTHMRAFINKVNTEFQQVTNSTLNTVEDLYSIKDEDIDLLLKEGYVNNELSTTDIHHDKQHIQHTTTTTIKPQTTTTTVTIIENSIIESENIQQLPTTSAIPMQQHHHQEEQPILVESEEFTKYIQEDEIGDTNYIEDSQDNNNNDGHHSHSNEQIEDEHEIEDDDEEEEEEEDYSNQIIKHQEILLMTNEEIHDGNIQEITMSNIQFNEIKQESDHYENQNIDIKKNATVGSTSLILKNSIKNENSTHMCIKCDKDFSTKTNLMRHMLTHDGIKPYQCTICGNGFTQNGSLKSHMLIHTGERPHRCEVCGRGFTQSKSLTFHMRRHTGEKPFTCITCGLNFRQKDGLKRHIQIKHSGMPSESHQCTICNRILHSKYSLALHMRKHLYRHHQQQQDNKETIDIDTQQQSNKKIFKCDECNKEFSRKNSLSVHKKIHDEKQIKNNNNNNNDNNNSNSKVFQCGKCFKSFSIKRNLLQHLRNHNKETLDLYKCDACSIAFNTKRGLKLHRYNEHKETVSDLNECDICNIPFVSVHDLNQHMINIHDNINEKCGICLQNFTSKKLYEDHILEHEIEQEYTIT